MRLIGINLRMGSPNTVRVAVVHANTFKESVHQRSLYLLYKAIIPAPIPNRQATIATENKILRSQAQYQSILSEKLESHPIYVVSISATVVIIVVKKLIKSVLT